MGKNMQMPVEFVNDVYKLIILLDDIELDENARALCKTLEAQIKAKIDAMDRRKTFTEYKTTEPGEAREQKRREYLDKAGIHKDWRTPKESYSRDL